jgi:hypothetical protein
MGLIVDCQQLIGREMRILLRGIERRMSQHLLNGAQVGSFIKEMRGKRMP